MPSLAGGAMEAMKGGGGSVKKHPLPSVNKRAVRILLEWILVTACKRSLGQGNIFRSVCQEFCSRGGGGIPACLAGLQAHTQGKVEGSGLGEGVSRPTPRGVSPDPHPGGVSRPTPRGSLQAHTWGVSRPTPGGVSRPTPGGLQAHTRGSPGPHWGGGSQHALRQIPPPQQTATVVGGTHPTGMHSCFYNVFVTGL